MTKNFFASSWNVRRLAPLPNAVGGEQLLQLLRERRLRDAAAADAEQLDLVVERRVLAIVQRAHDVVRRRQALVAIQLPARQADTRCDAFSRVCFALIVTNICTT